MKSVLLIMLFFISASLNAQVITLEQREFKLKNFPCLSCHGNFTSTEIHLPPKKPHDDLKFKHMKSITNCFQCHDQKDRNSLILLNGEKIGFNDSHRQCFQCHGEKKRDWELGMHGKLVGSWSGDKYKYTCTSCHNPHAPQFRQMKADPKPIHPHAHKNKDKKDGGH